MFMIPMGDNDDPRSPNSYKSAAVDTEYVDVTPEQEELIPTDNDKYKRLIKVWILFQEVTGQVALLSVSSTLFTIFRAVNWFPFVVFLFGFSIFAVVIVYAAMWRQFRPIERVRYFLGCSIIGLATVVSGSDIIADWVQDNQGLVKGVLIGATIIGVGVGCKFLFNLTNRKRRY